MTVLAGPPVVTARRSIKFLIGFTRDCLGYYRTTPEHMMKKCRLTRAQQPCPTFRIQILRTCTLPVARKQIQQNVQHFVTHRLASLFPPSDRRSTGAAEEDDGVASLPLPLPFPLPLSLLSSPLKVGHRKHREGRWPPVKMH